MDGSQHEPSRDERAWLWQSTVNATLKATPFQGSEVKGTEIPIPAPAIEASSEDPGVLSLQKARKLTTVLSTRVVVLKKKANSSHEKGDRGKHNTMPSHRPRR